MIRGKTFCISINVLVYWYIVYCLRLESTCTHFPSPLLCPFLALVFPTLSAAGQYAPSRTKACVDCDVGKINAKSTNSAYSCKDCFRGQYQDQIGKNICATCPSAKYSSSMGSEVCQDCTAGQYKAGDMQDGNGCNSCVAGRVFNGDYSTVDLSKKWIGWCSAKSYTNVDGTDLDMSSCVRCNSHSDCPDGRMCYGTAWCIEGTVLCGDVDTDYRCTYASPDLCADCAVGQYQSHAVATTHACLSCELGFEFKSSTTACAQCAQGMYRTAKDASCQFCPRGRWFQNTKKACIVCSSGMYQFESNKLHAQCQRCQAGSEYKLERPTNDLATHFKPLSTLGTCASADGTEMNYCTAQLSDTKCSAACFSLTDWCFAYTYGIDGDTTVCRLHFNPDVLTVNIDCELALKRIGQEAAAISSGNEFGKFGTWPATAADGGGVIFSLSSSSSSSSSSSQGSSETQGNVAWRCYNHVNLEESCVQCSGQYQIEGSGSLNSKTARYTTQQCRFCTPGKQFASITAVCTLCEIGKYQDKDDASSVSCSSCSKNTYAANKLASECSICPGGFFQEKEVATEYVCSSCASGKEFIDGVCKMCQVGRYRSEGNVEHIVCQTYVDYCNKGVAVVYTT